MRHIRQKPRLRLVGRLRFFLRAGDLDVLIVDDGHTLDLRHHPSNKYEEKYDNTDQIDPEIRPLKQL